MKVKTAIGTKVELRDGIIWIPEAYNATAVSIREATVLAGKLIIAEKRAGRPALVRLALSNDQDATSDERRAAMRELLQLPFTTMTITGTKRKTLPVLQFMISSLGRSHEIKISRSNGAAMAWQMGRQLIPASSSIIAAMIVATGGGITGLIGFGTGELGLRDFGFGGRPMSLLTALLFVLVGIALGMQLCKRETMRRSTGWVIVSISILGLIAHTMMSPTQLAHGIVMSIFGALLFILFGSSFVWPSRYRSWARLPLAIILAAIVVVFMLYLYNITVTTSFNLGRDIPFGSALLFAAISILVLLGDNKTMLGARNIATPSTIAVIALVVAVQVVTAIGWRQTEDHLHDQSEAAFQLQTEEVKDSITSRLNSYINVLYGLRSFYHASDFVSKDDFHNYIDNLNVARDYPGFTAFTYIETVSAANKAAYNAMLARTYGAGTAIYPAGNRSEYFPVTYLSNNSSKAYGYDLGSSSTRLSGLTTARASGEPLASDTIDLNASSSLTTPRPGFFITIPLYRNSVPTTSTARLAASTGFVNAYFEYKVLFAAELTNLSKDVHVQLYDGSSTKAKSIYATGPTIATTHSTGRVPLVTAGKTWELVVSAPHDFGTSSSDRNFSALILFTGNLVDILLFIYMVVLIRGRVAAVHLAERMTVDLKHERDLAVEQQGKDEAILSSIGDGVFAVDQSGMVFIFNEAATIITGIEPDHIIGKHYRDLLDFRNDRSDKPHYEFVTRALAGHKAFMDDNTVLIKGDGSRVPVADSAAPIKRASGEIMGAIVVFRDVTKEREVEQAKDEFVSLASHQLRTPATGVKQFLGMMREGYAGKMTKEQRDMVEDAYLSNERQLGIIEDMLNVAKADAGRIVLERTTTDITGMVRDIVSEQQSVIQNRKQTVTVKLPRTKLKADVDEHRLRMVVENLVSNASKYTQEGGTITITAKQASTGILSIAVTDSGVGIATEDLTKLFGKFSRINNPLSTKVGGSGLGLYLAKRIIDLHHGTIDVDSIVGKGTTFTITLPN